MALALGVGVAALVAPHATATVTAQSQGDLDVAAGSLTGSASAYRSINPIRILDTRTDPAMSRLWAETSLSIDPVTNTGVASAAGVDPADITAVIVNTTIVNTGGRGFGTVWPTGSTRLQTSTNNAEFAGHTIPNLVIAPLGLDHKVSVYSSTPSDVVLDVLGVFVASGSTAAGRFESLGPVRAFDTRDAATPEFDAGTTRTVDLKAVGVPADATGAIMNVTAIRSRARGFYKVWAAGQPQPAHSNVNVLEPGYQAGNQVISGLTNGQVDVYSSNGGGLTIDVTGYFTGSSSAADTEGLYVPFTPVRLLDTREAGGDIGQTGGAKVDANEEFQLQVGGRSDIPAGGAKAVALNLTAIRADARGFVTAYPSGTAAPATSSLNFTTGGQTVPNHAITSLDATTGRITLQPSQSTHLAVDATGYFLAAGATPPTGGATVTKTVNPGAFVPAPLATSAPTAGPYDFLFDRGNYLATGIRPNPTIRSAWDNCQPINYVLNVDLAANDQQIQILIDSIEEVEEYTGIDFRYGGVTSAGMNLDDQVLIPENAGLPHRYLPPLAGGGQADVVIGFSDATDTPELESGVIGIGGSLRRGADADGRARSLRGFAVIDLADLDRDGPAGAGTLKNVEATVTHELGHMMGLGHVDTTPNGRGLVPGASDAEIRDQLMYPSLNPSGEPNFDDGDQRGLFELYGNRACGASGALGGDESPDVIDWSEVEVSKPVDDFG